MLCGFPSRHFKVSCLLVTDSCFLLEPLIRTHSDSFTPKTFLYTFYSTGHHIFSRSSTKDTASPCVIRSSPNTNSVALFATTKHLKFNDGQRSTRHWLASGSNQLHVLKNPAIQSTSRPDFRRFKYRARLSLEREHKCPWA